MKPIFILSGEIVHGKEIGRKMDMPTANLDILKQTLPPFGVYASVIEIGDKSYMGITNIGFRPTIDNEKTATAETYILDFSGSIYGERVILKLYEKLRETFRFSSKKALREQIRKDEEKTRTILHHLF